MLHWRGKCKKEVANLVSERLLKPVSKQELGVEKEKETPQKVWLVMTCSLKIRAPKRESVRGRWKRLVLRNNSIHFGWEVRKSHSHPCSCISPSLAALRCLLMVLPLPGPLRPRERFQQKRKILGGKLQEN